jgi:hypothetical protein
MKLNIKPQDPTPPEDITLSLHPKIISRLQNYSESMNSNVSHIAGLIFDQTLPKESAPRKDRAEKKGKLERMIA